MKARQRSFRAPVPPFVLLLAAVFLGAVDQTVVAATLPAIVSDLGLPINRLDDVSWTITAYLAGYALILPLAGQMADRVRRPDLFVIVCLAIFAVGSSIVGIGQDLLTVVIGRFIQAVGAGALLPVAFGQISGAGGVSSLVTRIGWVTAIAEGGALLGPVYGAGAIQLLSWRWVFLLNVPLVLLLGWLLVRAWPRGIAARPAEPVDWRGAALLGASLCVLTVALSRESTQLHPTLGRILLGILGVALAGWFYVAERGSTAPLLPLTLFWERRVPATLLTHLLCGAALMVPLLVVPLWGNTLLGLAPEQAALLLARLTLSIPIGALIGSWLGSRLPLAALASAGMLLSAFALVLMAGWPDSVNETTMTPALLLAGFGFGVMIAPTNATAIGAAGLAHAASAASLVQVSRLIGMTLSSAALASFGLDHFNQLVANLSLADANAYVQAVSASAREVFTGLFRAGAVVATGGAITAALSWKSPK